MNLIVEMDNSEKNYIKSSAWKINFKHSLIYVFIYLYTHIHLQIFDFFLKVNTTVKSQDVTSYKETAKIYIATNKIILANNMDLWFRFKAAFSTPHNKILFLIKFTWSNFNIPMDFIFYLFIF